MTAPRTMALASKKVSEDRDKVLHKKSEELRKAHKKVQKRKLVGAEEASFRSARNLCRAKL